jgi:hypothetical protein
VLQDRERDRSARGGGGDLHRLVGLQDGDDRRDPSQPGHPGPPRRQGGRELGLRRARPEALLGRGQGGEVRRGHRGGGVAHAHPQPRLAPRRGPPRGLAGSGEASRHRDLQRPPALRGRPLRDDARDGQVYFDRSKDLAARAEIAEWGPLAAAGGAR